MPYRAPAQPGDGAGNQKMDQTKKASKHKKMDGFGFCAGNSTSAEPPKNVLAAQHRKVDGQVGPKPRV